MADSSRLEQYINQLNNYMDNYITMNIPTYRQMRLRC
jgi:hypothetical protein